MQQRQGRQFDKDSIIDNNSQRYRKGKCISCKVAFVWPRAAKLRLESTLDRYKAKEDSYNGIAACPRCGKTLVQTTALYTGPWFDLTTGERVY